MKSILASLMDGESQIARGIVSNISISGARVVTDVLIDQGRTVKLRMFPQKRRLVETEARVVWGTESIEPTMEVVGALQGVQFMGVEPHQHRDIRRMLISPDFRDMWTPPAQIENRERIENILVDPDIEKLIANLGPYEAPDGDAEDEFGLVRQELLENFDRLFDRLKGT
jgi:hypothetical protein